jgi:hypothetical protein
MATDFEEGVLVGLLVGEGHFGGDGRQPHVTLRMHERHEVMFRWIDRTFPGGRLYGPYDHGGRRYYQWMARGRYLREELVPLLEGRLSAVLDDYARGRFDAMVARYTRQLHTGPTGEDTVGHGTSREHASAGRGGLTTEHAHGRGHPRSAREIFSSLRGAVDDPDG